MVRDLATAFDFALDKVHDTSCCGTMSFGCRDDEQRVSVS